MVARGAHVGNDQGYLLMCKHHINQQIFSHISKDMATNNLVILIPWIFKNHGYIQAIYEPMNMYPMFGFSCFSIKKLLML